MEFRSKNLLVTGGAGFIGSNFIKYILGKYKDVNIYNLDLLTYAGDLSNTKDFAKNFRYKFIQGDICDYNLVSNIFNDYSIDGVINFAAESHVDNSILNPMSFITTNVIGVNNLLNCAKNTWLASNYRLKEKYKMARFHQVSTDEIYGSTKKGSNDENAKYKPNSPYSASKASADLIVRSFFKTYGLNVSISVSSNNFGPNQNKEKLIPKIIHCIQNDLDIPIYGSGNNYRDWIYVDDHCRAIDLIFNKSKAGEKYNVGSGKEISGRNY